MKTVLALLLACCLCQPAGAGIKEGIAAYNTGRFDVALDEFLAAADQGSAEAQVSLGVMYENGQGVLRDYEKTLGWYRKAADQGHFGAQNNLGLMYAAGRGVAKNAGQAQEWYAKAAEQGFAPAQNNLAQLYASGALGKKDYAKALEWDRKAANQGFAIAHGDLGSMYENGLGVPKNLVVAYTYYTIAVGGGYEPATAQRNAVAKQLSSDQRDKALWAAQTWRPGDGLPSMPAAQ
ncbi:MAG: tetratricopeptide repeat protein [Casimicrobiaceae bacterium]